MFKRLGFVLWVLGITAQVARGQAAPDAEQTFRDDILNKKLFLKCMSADPTVRYEWDGKGLSVAGPTLHTVAAFVPQRVAIKRGRIEIEGSRNTLVKLEDDKYDLAGNFPVLLTIDLNGAKPSDVLPVLKDLIFISSTADALAEIPPEYATMLPFKVPEVTKNPSPKSQPDPPPGVCAAIGSLFVYPKVIKSANPEFSDESRRAHFSGAVFMLFTVEENGHPSDIWIASPAGFGLDEEAVKAVSEYLFQPATCDGKPIKMPVVIKTDFKLLGRRWH